MVLKSTKAWKLDNPNKDGSSLFIDSKTLLSGPSGADNVQSLAPINLFDRVSKGLRRKKLAYTTGVAVLCGSCATALVMASKAYSSDLSQLWTYLPIPVVTALLTIPLFKFSEGKNHRVGWADIERLSKGEATDTGLKNIYFRASWLKDHDVIPYDLRPNFLPISGRVI